MISEDDEKELLRIAKKIGAKIGAIIESSRLDKKTVAEAAGYSPDAFKNVLAGKSCVQWVKLGKLARAIGTTPSALLDFEAEPTSQGTTRDFFRGALEGTYIALGLSPPQSVGLAATVLGLLVPPQDEDGEIPLRRVGRLLGAHSARKFVESKQH